MSAHPDFVAAFEAALGGAALPHGLTAPDPDEAARRFAVYRNNVAVGLCEALAARFPVIQRLVGEEFFRAMAQIFTRDHRPATPVISDWGQDFPQFLDGFAPLSAYPYMGDVARIEFARGRAYHAADASPVSPALLQDADPQRLRLGLHPSVAVLRLAHPAVSIWAQSQPESQAAPLPAGPEIALILRDPAFQVQVHALTPADALLAEALLAGLPLADAALQASQADPGHDPQPLLVLLMRTGSIVGAKG